MRDMRDMRGMRGMRGMRDMRDMRDMMRRAGTKKRQLTMHTMRSLII